MNPEEQNNQKGSLPTQQPAQSEQPQPQTPQPNVYQPDPSPNSVVGQTVVPSQPNTVTPQQPTYGQTPTVFGGSPVQPQQNVTSGQVGGKSYLGAFLFSLFLGWLGVDRFYLGYIGTGILKLLTFGGFGIWVLIDLVMIFTNNKKAKDGTDLNGYEQNKRAALIILLISIFISAFATISSVVRGVNTINSIFGGGTSFDSSSSGQKEDNKAVTNIGNPVEARSFSVKVVSAVKDPAVEGEQPDSGMQYVQVDLSVTNNGSSEEILPGAFYYKTESGEELVEATVIGTSDGKDLPGKNISSLAGDKEIMVVTTVPAGQTLDNGSMIFQVPKGDGGQLIWRDSMFAKQGAILGTFNLK